MDTDSKPKQRLSHGPKTLSAAGDDLEKRGGEYQLMKVMGWGRVGWVTWQQAER